MKQVNKVASVVIRKLWTIAAIMLVFVALCVSLLRYSLPLLEGREHLVEEYVKNEYGIDLAIGAISASWNTSGPSIELREIDVQQGELSPVSLEIEQVYLAIDFWPTVFQQKLQSRNVELNGLHLTLDLDSVDTSTNNSNLASALESVFFEQLTQFSVSNSELSLRQNQKQHNIQIKQLSWLNDENRHQGLGEFALAGFASNTASFIVDLYGTIDSYSGTLYAQGNDLDVSPWFNQFIAADTELTESSGNFVLWADITKSKLTNVRAELKPSEFKWQRSELVDLTAQISANIGARLVGSTLDTQVWSFAIEGLNVTSNGETFSSDLLGKFVNGDEFMLHTASQVELSALLPLADLMSRDLSEYLKGTKPAVAMPRIHMRKDQGGLALVAQNNQVSWSQYKDFPGLDELLVDLYWKHNEGLVRLGADNAILGSSELFDKPLKLDAVDVSLRAQKHDDAWLVASEPSSLSINSASITPNIRFDSSVQKLSVAAKIDSFTLDKVSELLPNKFLGTQTKTYLNKAITGVGKIRQAEILWDGQFSAFPFSDNSGTFQASIDVEDAEFLFANEWPALKGLDIKLFFENRSLSMQSTKATLGGIPLLDLEASLPTLGRDSVLTINANAASDGMTVTKLMSQSSLQDTLGKVLVNDVLVAGPLSTSLSLNIPLLDANSTRATGSVLLENSDVVISAIDLELNNAQGVINFDNEALTIDGLNANLLGQQVTVNIISGTKGTIGAPDAAYELDISATGDWEVERVVANYLPQLNGYLDGKSQWKLNTLVSLFESSYEYTANLTSQLLNVDSSLPEPFAKSASDIIPLGVQVKGNKFASEVNASLGSDVRFEGILPHKELQFSRAHLALGQTDFVGMGVGFSVSANLPSMDVNNWYALIDSIVKGVSTSQDAGRSILTVPERIFAQTDQLVVSGNSVTDVNLVAKRLDRDWFFELDSDQIRGTASISSDWLSKGLAIDADYIKLDDYSPSTGSDGSNLDPKTFPRIRFNCDSCSFNGLNLGRVNIDALPNNDGMAINRLQIESQDGAITSSGQWYQRDNDHYSFLSGDLSSADFGSLLGGFGFDSGIKDSGAEVSFAFTWKDSPIDFSFEQLDGQIDWRLNDGYFTEVSDKGSRIFTLLSLNSLVRKLSLDFRDVFAKGFFYDEMSGSVQITEGKADTRDTVIDGGAGEIEIYGYADLVSTELNYNVSFAPNVTGNLPVLVYFFTVSPPSALAALALDQVLTSAKVISNVNYSITGTFDEPILIETGRQSTEVELPTRRDLFEDDALPDFLPPDPNEFIQMEQGSD